MSDSAADLHLVQAMSLHREIRSSSRDAERRPATADFCQIMSSCMDQLHWLAYVLTGDSVLAERCFVSGLGESLHFNQVFKDWAESWSRRAIIKNAIRMIRPRYGEGVGMAVTDDPEMPQPETADLTAMLLQLQIFDRFVFVMGILERYKDHECAALLNCPLAHVATARARVLREVGDLGALARTGLPA